VSRALGGFDDVAPATRARVLEEAGRIDYRPNRAARGLRRGRSEAVGVVLPSGPGQFDDPFFLRMLAAIGPALEQAGLDLLVTTARPRAEEMRVYRHLAEGRRVDGIVLARTRLHDERIAYLLDRGMPFVAHGRSAEERPFAFVDIDGEAATRAATERLIGFGHQAIALINAPPLYMFAHHREAGWRGALREAGLSDAMMVAAEPTEENGFLRACELLAAPQRPTAFVCATDRLAVGALHALAHEGLRAGRDVSVIGYDDLPVASWTDPPLTTIAQPIEAAARRMVEMLIALMAGGSVAGLQEVWEAKLIARRSDGVPAERGPDLRHHYITEGGRDEKTVL
jgi:LacI family transcriptional regulator